MRTYSNKVAVITGAGSGIGRALAVQLAKLDCAVAISDVVDDTLSETEALLDTYDVKVTRHLVDVADREAMERFAREANESHGKINLLFNNAGVSVTDSAEHMSYEDFEWLMNINFWGVVHGTKAFLPFLQQASEARIVNTSSVFGILSFPTQSAYNASKFAVRGYTEALRQELADTHIGVSCVHPGGVKTNIVKTSRYTPSTNESPTKEDFEETFEQMAALTSDEAALIILRGVKKNKARILVGRDAKLLSLISRLAPANYPRLLSLMGSDFADVGNDQKS
jgi:NAD(P)-dependent dehydrogenase (short-subunit alcohol dehydrogenase family)